MSEKQPYYQYALDVVEEKVVANRYVKMACRRFLEMLEDEQYYYDEKKVKKVIKFVESLELSTGHFAGKKFKLEPWQKFIVCGLYGLYYTETKRRVTRKAYIEVSRKSGKTSLLGALSLYELARGGKDAQVYCLAASRDQAHILFDATSEYAKGLDAKEQYFKLLRQEIRLPITNSKCKVLAADASRLDGVNASFFCVDEIEVQPNDKLYSVLATSQGMRLEPLAVCIGSGGNDINGFGYQMRETCIEVLEGLKQDPSQFSLIYCVDSVEEVENEDMWIKACPNLGVTVQKEYLREQLLSAKNNSALQNFVYSRQFGIWTKSAETWIDDLIVSNNTMEFDPCVLFNGYRTYMGVDLASVCDLTAVAYLCVIDDIYNFYVDYYLPFDSLDQSPYYEIWNKSGHLHITPDNATDFNYITDDIMKKKRDGIRIKEIAYDRYLSSQWVADMFQKGFKMKSFSQSIANFSAPTKEFQRLMLQGRIKIHANPINRWCISNVVLKEDYNQNVKPIKMQNKNKIDGCIAMIQALGIYMGDRKGDPDLKIIA